MRKKVISLFIFIAFIISVYFLWTRTNLIKQYVYFSPCDVPLEYKIGSIDPRFNLSRADLMQDLQAAEAIWENADEKNLFTYSDKAELTVNLVYDERQYLSTQINSSKNQVDQERQSLQPNITEYEEKSREFKTRVDALNAKISYWNSKGGAPPDEYAAIVKEQDSLQQLANQLNQMAAQLNQTTQEVNGEINNLNSTIDTYNTFLLQHPEGGIYSGASNTITLFFNNSKDEVIHTLAHEMGHALGMNHVPDPNAIMYFKVNNSLTPSPDDMKELARVCQKVSIFSVLEMRLKYLWSYFLTSLKYR